MARPCVHRRQLLWRGTGLLMAWPGIAAAADPAGPEAAAAACVQSTARLVRGERVDPGPAEGCGGSATPGVFQGASLAKPLVATLVLRRVLKGQLDLDRPLDALLPEGYAHRQNLFALREPPVLDPVPRDMLARITVRRLLSHTAGLPNWAEGRALRFAVEPGTRWVYSGEGYVLLQHLLQGLTGQTLQALAAQELFGPLGMADSAFRLTEHIRPALVAGRTASGQVRQLRFPHEIAAASLYTTAADYARFLAATLADRELLALVTTSPVAVPAVPGLSWGLGWGLEQTPGRRALWQWGANPGFRSLAMAELESGNAVVALVAKDSGMDQAKALLRQALPGPHPALALKLVS